MEIPAISPELRFVTYAEYRDNGLTCAEDTCSVELEPGMMCADVFEDATDSGDEVLVTVCMRCYLVRTSG